jgi:chlorophyll/bacteriochlorophyll a synthase
MEQASILGRHVFVPAPRDVLELLKPITWFPPMWAFLCGVVSAGVPLGGRLGFVLAGMMVVGPLVCGTSQAVNDWFDRHVDAINEPGRPIPSGRITGRWGLVIGLAGTVLTPAFGWILGPWVFGATLLGLACGWAYSVPLVRAKASGLWGPALVAIAYEGLSWFTGASVMLDGPPATQTLFVLGLYSAGAWGIMTLNDFKAVTGDRRTGVRSLPATIGIAAAARIACLVMAAPQLGVILLLWSGGHWPAALLVAGLLLGQLRLMGRLLQDPVAQAPWYNATGTSLYVLGMMISAIGLGGTTVL